jgi:hypothetical protein
MPILDPISRPFSNKSLFKPQFLKNNPKLWLLLLQFCIRKTVEIKRHFKSVTNLAKFKRYTAQKGTLILQKENNETNSHGQKLKKIHIINN